MKPALEFLDQFIIAHDNLSSQQRGQNRLASKLETSNNRAVWTGMSLACGCAVVGWLGDRCAEARSASVAGLLGQAGAG
jgi:hypothetical protein